MHELHHRANRVADQDLANNLFNVMLMPAILFQEWGDPIPKALATAPSVPQPHEVAGESQGWGYVVDGVGG